MRSVQCRLYDGLIKQLDDNVREILRALEQSGKEKDTVVVLLSDNGGTNAQVNNNFPYVGSKVSFLEGG